MVNMAGDFPLLLVEDDAMVREWLELVFASTEFRVAGAAPDIAGASMMASRRRVDLLLVDYHLPGARGTTLVRDLRRIGVTAPALMMTANVEPGFNELVREAGAQGTVLKTGSADEILGALRILREGGTAFDLRHPRRPAHHEVLTPRERDTVRLLGSGMTNREIAVELGIGVESVKTLLARAFVKLGVRRRAEAVAAAHELALI